MSIRETFYITKLIPYYNVLKTGYSSLGYKHTKETKVLLSKLAKNKIHTAETKSLIARALTGENNPFYNKTHSTETKVRMIEARLAYPVYIYSSYKILLTIFPSALTFAKTINSNHGTIVTYIKKQNLFIWFFYSAFRLSSPQLSLLRKVFKKFTCDIFTNLALNFSRLTAICTVASTGLERESSDARKLLLLASTSNEITLLSDTTNGLTFKLCGHTGEITKLFVWGCSTGPPQLSE